ncbi:MAG: acetate--CoA ligase family protein [Comamonadaceae bacterium]|nr:acetate--CoA ligase family protein [Comamonadaceae bacterium]
MIATQLGFPVALKIDSPDITPQVRRRTAWRLNVANAPGVRDHLRRHDRTTVQAPCGPMRASTACTIQKMAAPRTRPRDLHRPDHRPGLFGPVIAFGAGGTDDRSCCDDRAMELPPLNHVSGAPT